MKKILICVFFLLFLRNAGYSDIYYINSETGSDSNQGDISAPFASWGHALNVSKQNDEIKFSLAKDKPDFNIANAVIMLQDDIDSQIIRVDEGSWKERVEKSITFSQNAGLKTIIEYRYIEAKRNSGKKYMKNIGFVTYVETIN